MCGTRKTGSPEVRRCAASQVGLWSSSCTLVNGASTEMLNEMGLEGHAHAVFEGSLIPGYER